MNQEKKRQVADIIDDLIREYRIAREKDIVERYSEESGQSISLEEIHSVALAMENDPDLAFFAPLYKDSEAGGYLYADPKYASLHKELNSDELKDIGMAVSLLNQFKYRDIFRSFSGIIQKMFDLVSIKNLNASSEPYDFISFEINGVSKGSRFIIPLIHAIEGKRVVELAYQPFYEEKAHQTVVHPYLLKEYRYRWYLVGRNDLSGEIRTYGLDRVTDIQETNRAYIEKDFSASDYFRNVIGVISPTGEPPIVRLRIDKPQAFYMISQPWHESQNIESEDELSVVFSFRVHPTYEFKSLIMSFGSEIEVVSPDSLREEIKKIHQDAAGRYEA